MQECSLRQAGGCAWWSWRHDVREGEPCPEGVTTGCRGVVVSVGEEADSWWLERALETLPPLDEELKQKVSNLLLQARRGGPEGITTLEWLKKFRGINVKEEIARSVDESGRVREGVSRTVVGQMFRICKPCAQGRNKLFSPEPTTGEEQGNSGVSRTVVALKEDAPTLSESVSAQREQFAFQPSEVYYGVTEGVPIVFAGGAGRNVSTDILVRRYAEALSGLRVDVRVHAKETPIEDWNDWNRLRKFVTRTEGSFAGVFIWRNDPSVPRSRTPARAIYSNYDSYCCFHSDIVRQFNEDADFIMTAGRHSAEVMRSCGVRNVVVVPHGVDANVFFPETVPARFPLPKGARVVVDNGVLVNGAIPAPLIVFFWFGVPQARKGIEPMVESFRWAFGGGGNRRQVALWVHARDEYWGAEWFKEVRDFMAREAAGTQAPLLLLTSGCISDDDLRRCLCRARGYLQTSLAEGFGLVGLQAMACGTLVIATDHAGHKEYCTDRNSLLIPCREVVADHRALPDYARGRFRWGEYDKADLAEALRRATEEVGLAEVLAIRGVETARAFTWERGAVSMLTAIEERVKVSRRVGYDEGLTSLLFPVGGSTDAATRMLRSLFATDHGGGSVEVILYNDTDDSAGWETLKREWGRKVKFVAEGRQGERRGCPFARNRLFAVSRGEWLFVGDCDIEFVQRGWLARLKEEYRKKFPDGMGILAPLLLFPNGTIQSAGGEVVKEEGRVVYGNRLRGRRKSEVTLKACPVPYAPAAAWLLHRRVVEEVGGFSEVFSPTFFDDTDFCYRAAQKGIQVWFVPDVYLLHHEGSWRGDRSATMARNASRFKVFWSEEEDR